MKLEVSKLSDVRAALDLVKGEIEKAEMAIRKEGADAMLQGRYSDAQSLIDTADKLNAFAGKIDALGPEWDGIGIDRPTPPPPPTPSAHGVMSVRFPDGTLISEKKANQTFAKAIEKIGPEVVAPLGISNCGEPLVTRNKDELLKYPSSVIPVVGGWFVNTQSSTESKAKTLKAIIKSLKLKKIVVKVASEQKPLFPYAVGKVVQAVFPVLQNDSRMKPETVAMLLKKESSKRFKVGGHSVLKARTGIPDETKDAAGIHRYYPDLPLRFFGQDYWLASQFQPHGILPVLEWLESIGMGRDEVLAICQKAYAGQNAK